MMDEATHPDAALLQPEKLWSRHEIMTRPCPIPSAPGIYAWYFSKVPSGVPIEDCHVFDGLPLLYIGISPKPPPVNGAKPSQQDLRKRLRYHYRGNAAGSTLRLTLGCLLEEELGIELIVAGPSGRMTFGIGEARLSEWMGEHTRIAWVDCEDAWVKEKELISRLSLPLNLDQNRAHAFRERLSALRGDAKRRAREALAVRGSTV
jgi:hypothetical protein